MREMILEGKDVDFEEPDDDVLAKAKPTPGELAKWKRKSDRFEGETKLYKKSKGKLWAKVLLLCEDEMRTIIELDPDFRAWQKENNVIKLLNKIELLSLTSDGVEPDSLELFHSLRKVIQTSLGQKEDIDRYKRKLLANVRVLEHQWGPFYPTKKGGTDTKMKKHVNSF